MCAEAVDLARTAAAEAAHPQQLGAYLGAVAEGDRLVTHLFRSEDPGYPGWHWAVTVTRASRARNVTVDEVVLAPGPDALLAPDWVPWSERLRPGDLGPGDLLPAGTDDVRLEPGYTGADLPPPDAATGARPGEEPGEEWTAGAADDAGRGGIADVARELGMGRPRVLSRHGLHDAAERWDEQYGPRTAMAQSAPADCAGCGFLLPLAGSLRQSFGVCANEYSPADGHVVALTYGCGAHSEAAGTPGPQPPAPPVIDHVGADPL